MLSEKDDRDVNLQEMKDNHHKIAQLAALGWRNDEIAERLNMNPSYISQLRNHNPLIRRKVSELRRRGDDEVVDIKQELSELLPAAVSTFREILENPEAYHGSLRFATAKQICGLNGIVAPKNVKVLNVSTAMSPDLLAELVGSLASNAERAGVIIPE